MGIGNPDRGDDGFGVRLAEAVRAARIPGRDRGRADARALRSPRSCGAACRPVLFLDAVEFGGGAGAVVLLDAREMAARFPQVSTHKLSLGMLARLIEAEGATRVVAARRAAASRVDHAAGLSDAGAHDRWRSCATCLAEVLPVGTEPLAVCGERP